MRTNLRYMCFYFVWCLILSAAAVWITCFVWKEYYDAKRVHTELHTRVSRIEAKLEDTP